MFTIFAPLHKIFAIEKRITNASVAETEQALFAQFGTSSCVALRREPDELEYFIRFGHKASCNCIIRSVPQGSLIRIHPTFGFFSETLITVLLVATAFMIFSVPLIYGAVALNYFIVSRMLRPRLDNIVTDANFIVAHRTGAAPPQLSTT